MLKMDSCFCAIYCICREECICEPDCLCSKCYKVASGSSHLASDTRGAESTTVPSEYAARDENPERPGSNEADWVITDLNGKVQQPKVTALYGSSNFARRSSSKSRRTGKKLTIPVEKDDASRDDSKAGGSNQNKLSGAASSTSGRSSSNKFLSSLKKTRKKDSERMPQVEVSVEKETNKADYELTSTVLSPTKHYNFHRRTASQNISREAGEGPSRIAASDADKFNKNENFRRIRNALQQMTPQERLKYLMSENFSVRDLLQLPRPPLKEAKRKLLPKPRMIEPNQMQFDSNAVLFHITAQKELLCETKDSESLSIAVPESLPEQELLPQVIHDPKETQQKNLPSEKSPNSQSKNTWNEMFQNRQKSNPQDVLDKKQRKNSPPVVTENNLDSAQVFSSHSALTTLPLYSSQGLPLTNLLHLPGMTSRHSLQGQLQLNTVSPNSEYLLPSSLIRIDSEIRSLKIRSLSLEHFSRNHDLPSLIPPASNTTFSDYCFELKTSPQRQEPSAASLDLQSLSSFQNHPNILDSFPPGGFKSISQRREQESSFTSNENISASSQNQKQSTFPSNTEKTIIPSNKNASNSESNDEISTFTPNEEMILKESTFTSATAGRSLNTQKASELPENISPQRPTFPSSGPFRMLTPYSPLSIPPPFIPRFTYSSSGNASAFRQRESEMPDSTTGYVPLLLLKENTSPQRPRMSSPGSFRALTPYTYHEVPPPFIPRSTSPSNENVPTFQTNTSLQRPRMSSPGSFRALTPYTYHEVPPPFIPRSTSPSNENVPTFQTNAEMPDYLPSDNESTLIVTAPNLCGEDACLPNLQDVEETLRAIDNDTPPEESR